MAKADLNTGLEREIEETRERLAGTIDELIYRTHPKTIASRQKAAIKAMYVDPVTGEPNTANIAKTAASVLGVVVLFVALRTFASRS
jgi:hypothetical protein